MKNYFPFIVRLSIINFFLYMLVVVIIANIGEKIVKREIQKRDNPVKISPTSTSSSTVPTLGAVTPASTENLSIQLQIHNSKGDCWMMYEGYIYNITSFFGSHPGGDAIMLPYCGKDATTAFNGVPHSDNAKSLLQQYLIQ